MDEGENDEKYVRRKLKKELLVQIVFTDNLLLSLQTGAYDLVCVFFNFIISVKKKLEILIIFLCFSPSLCSPTHNIKLELSRAEKKERKKQLGVWKFEARH